jgi:hypothetical protein
VSAPGVSSRQAEAEESLCPGCGELGARDPALAVVLLVGSALAVRGHQSFLEERAPHV